MKIISYSNPDTKIRAFSSAGGAFSKLADKFLTEGGIVYGAAFDPNWNVVHKRIDNLECLDSIRRSKYVYSEFSTAINNAIKDLKEGKSVLFSGTPCQIAAIKKLAPETDNLLCVEVVCHGSPEKSIWNRYLDEEIHPLKKERKDISNINFRDKSTGWKNYSFTIEFTDGSKISMPHNDNPYMKSFLADLTLRKPCFSCKFKYPEGTKADITLGDLWGISAIAPSIDNDLGTTLVIARTPLGEKILDSLTNDATIPFDKANQHNPSLTTPASKPGNYESFKAQVKTAEKIIPIMKSFTKDSLKVKLRKKLSRIKKIIVK